MKAGDIIWTEIKKEKFHIRRYDDLKIDTKPLIIKIDAEGFEHEIIKGMMTIPDGPGLGIQLNMDVVRQLSKQ